MWREEERGRRSRDHRDLGFDRRVRNQRTQSQLNRLLDTANLVWDIVRALR